MIQADRDWLSNGTEAERLSPGLDLLDELDLSQIGMSTPIHGDEDGNRVPGRLVLL